MSPLWEVAATTGMGGGGGGAALVLFGHRKYAIKPTRIRTHSDSHTQRRREGLVFPGRAPWAGAAVPVSGGDFGLSGICEDCTNAPIKSAEAAPGSAESAGSQPPRYSTWAYVPNRELYARYRPGWSGSS